ncbi:hypothetical protein AVEN_135706-1 [Araneus ventricosus]|uniref:Uncharacterized protein n=1 Tax=Araneus ventricosus TaxID=182803 RepID=A0A4Y2V8V2_ARAVE|nr:hypothetical protein AVEN_135706-1 [Araneus ventricosus]
MKYSAGRRTEGSFEGCCPLERRGFQQEGKNRMPSTRGMQQGSQSNTFVTLRKTISTRNSLGTIEMAHWLTDASLPIQVHAAKKNSEQIKKSGDLQDYFY